VIWSDRATTSTSLKLPLSIVGHPTAAVRGWWVKKFMIPGPSFVPYTLRHRVPLHTSYSITASHTFTQNHRCFHERAVSCRLTRATTEKIFLRQSPAEMAHFSRIHSENTVLAGKSCKCKPCTNSKWQKVQKVLLQNPPEEPNVFVLRPRFSACCTKGVQQGYTRHRLPFHVFRLSFVFLIALPRKLMSLFYFAKLPINATKCFLQEFGD